MIDHILSILIFFPALAGMFGFMIQKDSIRAYGVAVSAIEFALSLVLYYKIKKVSNIVAFIFSISIPSLLLMHLSMATFFLPQSSHLSPMPVQQAKAYQRGHANR